MNAIIIEDEELAARNLIKVLNQLGNIRIQGVLESIVDTVEWFNENDTPDVVFMDIHLADGSAFEIFNRTKINCPIIFTTAYDEYALKAFKVNSIDYLLKPLDLADVQKALQKLENLTRSNYESKNLEKLYSFLKSGVQEYKTHFLVEMKGDKLLPLNVSEIAYVFVDNGLVRVFTFDKRKLVLQNTLDELSNLLNPKSFFRANRQYIVAREAIKDIDLWFNNRLSLNLKVAVDEKIVVSKARVTEFKSWFA